MQFYIYGMIGCVNETNKQTNKYFITEVHGRWPISSHLSFTKIALPAMRNIEHRTHTYLY